MAEIVKTIGATGRDYATPTLWEADLDNAGIYTAADDARGDVYNDAVINDAFTINGGGGIGLTSRKLTVPSSERHDGTENTGSRIEYNGGAGGTLCLVAIGNTTVEWLEILPKMEFTLEVLEFDAINLRAELMGSNSRTSSVNYASGFQRQ